MGKDVLFIDVSSSSGIEGFHCTYIYPDSYCPRHFSLCWDRRCVSTAKFGSISSLEGLRVCVTECVSQSQLGSLVAVYSSLSVHSEQPWLPRRAEHVCHWTVLWRYVLVVCVCVYTVSMVMLCDAL